MGAFGKLLNPVVAAFWAVLLSFGATAAIAQDGAPQSGVAPDSAVPGIAAPEAEVPEGSLAQSEILDKLFAELADPENKNWQMTEQNIWIQWSRSGSPAMDLLLQRGRQAMEDGNLEAAIEHLTALVDHAPDFAEGWNARATAYYNAGLYGPSIDDVRHVLALNPRHFGALSGLGMMLEEMDYPKDALEAYEAARAIHPNQPGVLDAIKRLHAKLDGQEL
jgi:tetratricopeptide (TPR) repeat protein